MRIHDDAAAAASAASIGALAYTVGRDVVFAAGQFAPDAKAGPGLLAHELTHVAQHGVSATRADRAIPFGGLDDAEEREANRNEAGPGFASIHATAAQAILRMKPPPVGSTTATTGSTNPSVLDTTATTIISDASDTSVTVDKRAVAFVRAIIAAYFPSQAGLVKDVVFDTKLTHGMATGPSGSGAATQGIISASAELVDFSSDPAGRFAHRVLQVDHELEHIRQFRDPSTAANAHLREFLAFSREAMEAALPHTGTVRHNVRVAMINAAIGEYYCLDDALKKQYEPTRDLILAERKKHEGKGVDPDPPLPTSCVSSKTF